MKRTKLCAPCSRHHHQDSEAQTSSAITVENIRNKVENNGKFGKTASNKKATDQKEGPNHQEHDDKQVRLSSSDAFFIPMSPMQHTVVMPAAVPVAVPAATRHTLTRRWGQSLCDCMSRIANLVSTEMLV